MYVTHKPIFQFLQRGAIFASYITRFQEVLMIFLNYNAFFMLFVLCAILTIHFPINFN